MRWLAALLLPEWLFTRWFVGPLRIIVDGNIGAGKSSLIAALKQALQERGLRVKSFPENVDAWLRMDILQSLYDPRLEPRLRSICAAAFQLLGPVYDQIKRTSATQGAQVLIQERCEGSAREVFLRACQDPRYKLATMDKDHAAVVREISRAIPDAAGTRTLRLCLHVPAAECARRVAARARQGEGRLSTADLECLEDYYLAFWASRPKSETCAHIDANRSAEQVAQAALKRIHI